MVRGCAEPGTGEAVRHPLSLCPGLAVHDPGSFWPSAEEFEQLVVAVRLSVHGVVQVRPVEAPAKSARPLQAELSENIGFDPVRRRCRESAERCRRKPFPHLRQTTVFGAKIMAPLRDAMGLVDGKEGDRY